MLRNTKTRSSEGALGVNTVAPLILCHQRKIIYKEYISLVDSVLTSDIKEAQGEKDLPTLISPSALRFHLISYETLGHCFV